VIPNRLNRAGHLLLIVGGLGTVVVLGIAAYVAFAVHMLERL